MISIHIAKRHIRHYIRDISAVLFSLISVFIIIGLYIFFLADMQTKAVSQYFIANVQVDILIANWVLGGLVCIPAVSVPLMILAFKIDDIEDGTDLDFRVSPVRHLSLVSGHIIAAWLIGFIMTLITLGLGQLYIISLGGATMTIVTTLKVIGILGLMILAFTGFSYFIISFVKTRSASIAVSSIYNTLIGFFAGLYIPIGEVSEKIATVIKSFPLAQGAALIRNYMMASAIETTFADIPAAYQTEFRGHYGIDIWLGNHLMTEFEVIIILIGFTLLFYILSIIRTVMTKRK